jgi:hypothetical protein
MKGMVYIGAVGLASLRPSVLMADRVEHVFAVVGQVQQETIGVGLGEVLDQARHHEVVVQHCIVVTVVGRQLVVTDRVRDTLCGR